MTLLPAAQQIAPYAVRALLAAAENGLTARRVQLACTDIRNATTGLPVDLSLPLPEPVSVTCPPAPTAVRLHITTPLRIRLRGDLLTGRTLLPEHLLAASVRRLRSLGMALPQVNDETLRQSPATLRFTECRLGWLETTRLSSRQNARLQMGGIVGEATLNLSGAPHIWPLLWAASILHLGKGASMGFGRIQLEAL